jgi:hypothetical protein
MFEKDAGQMYDGVDAPEWFGQRLGAGEVRPEGVNVRSSGDVGGNGSSMNEQIKLVIRRAHMARQKRT